MGITATETFIVSTWTKPDDDAALRTGLWRLTIGDTPTAIQLDPAATAIYWAAPEPGAQTLLLLNNDEERSSLLRWSAASAQTDVPRWSSGGEGGSYLSFHPESRHFIVSNSSAGWSLFRQGEVPELLATISNEGSGPHPRQSGSHPHCAIFSADGRWIHAADMGADEVLSIPFDVETETLGPVVRAHKTAPGAGPRHLVAGRGVVYLLNELDSTIEVLDPHDDGSFTSRQALSTLPGDFRGESHGAHLGMSPDGTHLYATNRQHDSIVCFTISGDGLLDATSWTPTGGWPWHFRFTRSGRLLVANNQSDEIAVYDIDDTGRPTRTGSVQIPRPVFIAVEP